MTRLAAQLACLSLLSLSAATWAADPEPPVAVTFTVEGIRPGAAMLTLALFRPASPEWGKRFKHAQLADLRCQQRTTGGHPREDLVCHLEPGAYIVLAFLDTDADGTLTHGLLGPVEQFGISGVGRPIKMLPPEPSETVIKFSKAARFSILLN